MRKSHKIYQCRFLLYILLVTFLGSCASKSEKEARRLYEAAQTHFKKGEYEKTITRDIVKCCGWIFLGLNIGAASRTVFIFSSAQPPKPDSANSWCLTPASIWLRLGGDDLKTASPKASPYPSRLPVLSGS